MDWACPDLKVLAAIRRNVHEGRSVVLRWYRQGRGKNHRLSGAGETQSTPHELDEWSGVENLRADFTKFVRDVSQAARGQLEDCAEMDETTRPSLARHGPRSANGNAENARALIFSHIDGLRQQWANTWDLFGKTPAAIPRAALADLYEKSLWAVFLIPLLNGKTEEPYQSYTSMDDGTGGRDPEKLVDNAVVRRLQDLGIISDANAVLVAVRLTDVLLFYLWISVTLH